MNSIQLLEELKSVMSLKVSSHQLSMYFFLIKWEGDSIVLISERESNNNESTCLKILLENFYIYVRSPMLLAYCSWIPV